MTADGLPPGYAERQGRMKAQAVFMTRLAIVSGVVLVVLVVVLQLVITSTIRESQIDSVRRSKATQQTAIQAGRAADRIEECTTPGQPCYDAGQKRTGRAVVQINKVVILAAACSVGLDRALPLAERQTQITTCVLSRLATP